MPPPHKVLGFHQGKGVEMFLHLVDIPGFRCRGPKPRDLFWRVPGVWVPEAERESSSLQGPPLGSFETRRGKIEERKHRRPECAI